MRCCSASVARILTLFSLVVVTSHSFILVNAQNAVPPTTNIDSPAVTPTSTPVSSPSLSPSPSPSPSPSTSPTHVSSPTPVAHSPSPTPSSDTQPSSTPSSVQHASSAPTTPSSTPSSTPSQTPTSQSTAETSAQSSSVSSSSASASSASSTLAGSSTVPTSTPGSTVTAPANTIAGSQTASYHRFSSTYLVNSPSLTPVVTGAISGASSSTSSFFDNKGAVAGVFTVVALVGLGIFVGVFFFVKKRRSRVRDEEDEVYFEKYNDMEHNNPTSPPFTNLGGLGQSSTDIATHASPDAYPDRSIHYGATSVQGSSSDYTNPNQYGVEYPPGTAYAAAASQQGQYQYTGQTGGHPDAGEAYYDSQARTPPGAHPFADPNNVPRRGVAPPVAQPYGYSLDSYYGNTGEGSGQGRA